MYDNDRREKEKVRKTTMKPLEVARRIMRARRGAWSLWDLHLSGVGLLVITIGQPRLSQKCSPSAIDQFVNAGLEPGDRVTRIIWLILEPEVDSHSKESKDKQAAVWCL
jgi:hypothetical protein